MDATNTRMRFSLRTLVILATLSPPLLGFTYYLATWWLARYLPESHDYKVPTTGGWRHSINPDGTVNDDL
jgi:hypothetical protein